MRQILDGNFAFADCATLVGETNNQGASTVIMKHQQPTLASITQTPSQVFELAKSAIIPILAQADIASVTVSYDGGGDEGSIHEIAAYAADDNPIDIPDVCCEKFERRFDGIMITEMASLADAIGAFADTALEALHSGWENGEGACGELKIDVATATASLEHNTPYISYDTTNSDL